ncbi:hypothetical protein CASFOL_039629 [Castilleja foliolosa]|uniref:RING-type E3 ubiquitin transferase n=1 Tax=Castilleja foliolosa TaxID=1961234 RepID=A0ABD3BG55_9LAMI
MTNRHRLLLDSDIVVLSNFGNKTVIGSYEDSGFDTDMVIILAALLCALVCALGLNSIIRCVLRFRRRFHYGAEVAAAAASSGSGGGLKKEELSRIPVAVYKPGRNIPATDCPICIGEFVEGEDVRILPRCNHGFHVKCIDAWLVLHSSCPNCRQTLIQEENV